MGWHAYFQRTRPPNKLYFTRASRRATTLFTAAARTGVGVGVGGGDGGNANSVNISRHY